jgi:hypothetical protein
MQMLVKEGHGFALIREGTILDDELTTRPIAGVDWTVDTAVIYHKVRHPKTVPILVRKFGRQFPSKREGNETSQGIGSDCPHLTNHSSKPFTKSQRSCLRPEQGTGWRWMRTIHHGDSNISHSTQNISTAIYLRFSIWSIRNLLSDLRYRRFNRIRGTS